MLKKINLNYKVNGSQLSLDGYTLLEAIHSKGLSLHKSVNRYRGERFIKISDLRNLLKIPTMGKVHYKFHRAIKKLKKEGLIKVAPFAWGPAWRFYIVNELTPFGKAVLELRKTQEKNQEVDLASKDSLVISEEANLGTFGGDVMKGDY